MENRFDLSGASPPGDAPRSGSSIPDPEPGPPPAASPQAAPADPAEPPAKEADPGGLERKKASGKDAIFEVSVVVLGALLLALLLKVYVAEAYQIRGRSMESTLLDGQRVMLQKIFYTIERGDIVIFTSKKEPNKDLIKRVIGIPGDFVEIRDGVVIINGHELEENYILQEGRLHLKNDSWRVEENRYFVLGDNRSASQDSRDFGLVDGASVRGKVILLWWPFQDLRAF